MVILGRGPRDKIKTTREAVHRQPLRLRRVSLLGSSTFGRQFHTDLAQELHDALVALGDIIEVRVSYSCDCT